MAVSKEYLEAFMAYVTTYGDEKAKENFKLESAETVNRYKRRAKQLGIKIPANSAVMQQIQERFTTEELAAIANGGRFMPGIAEIPIVSFEGKHIRIGVMTDTHIGHQCFEEERLFQAFEEFRKEKVDFVVHAGDVTEGMSQRPGHIYELSKLGYEAQKEYAIKLFSQWTETPIYAISGNHDRWYIKSSGANIVGDIAQSLPNFNFIGHDEGSISINGKASINLWHGEDGSSYALSYRLQKIIESLSGGEKPSVLIAGHVHKYVGIFERNVYALSAGTLERQTPWMRGKRLSAHVGFIILDLWVNNSGVAKMQHTWYPFYT